jgi:Big-like domain-containing protein
VQARKNAAAVRSALAEDEADSFRSLKALEQVEADTAGVTRRVDHAQRLLQAAGSNGLAGPQLITGEIGSLLGLLARLDSEGRYEEEIRVAKALHGLCVTAFRWLELVRSLRAALGAARQANDEAAEAWVLNELGALHLCAGNAQSARAFLDRAISLQQTLGDPYGRCATRHNCDCARRDYTHPLQLPGPKRALRWAPKGGLIAIAVAIGVAVAVGGSAAVVQLLRDHGNSGTTSELAAAIESGPANPTNETSATFSFSAEGARRFECALDKRTFKSCASPATFDDLSEGAHTFRVRAGAGGEWGHETRYPWRIDVTGPEIRFSERPSAHTEKTSASFVFEANEKVQRFECKLGGEGFAACASPQNLPGPLADGGYKFAVRAVDLAGNVGKAVSYSWTVAAAPGPVTEILTHPASLTNDTSAIFTLSSSEAGVTHLCRLDDTTSVSCGSEASYSDLLDGTHTFHARGVNALGTRGAVATWTWVIDTEAPAVEINDSRTVAGITSFTFYFDSTDPSSSFECRVKTDADFTPCKSGETYTFPESGDYTFQVRAIDRAGNVGQPDSVSFQIPNIG